MRQDYEKLFNQLKPALTPTGLFDQVVSRLGREQRLLSLRRLIALFTVSAVFSALALLPAGQAVWSGLSESGFTHFFSFVVGKLAGCQSNQLFCRHTGIFGVPKVTD